MGSASSDQMGQDGSTRVLTVTPPSASTHATTEASARVASVTASKATLAPTAPSPTQRAPSRFKSSRGKATSPHKEDLLSMVRPDQRALTSISHHSSYIFPYHMMYLQSTRSLQSSTSRETSTRSIAPPSTWPCTSGSYLGGTVPPTDQRPISTSSQSRAEI